MSAPLSPYGITKEQHDAIAATRDRPVTDGPMQVKPSDMRAVAPHVHADAIDEGLGGLSKATLARFTARRLARQQHGEHL